jgi:hypothetical protein
MTVVYHELHRGTAEVRAPMKLRKGDRVQVNLAPFIGSAVPSSQLIPCRVIDVRTAEVQVCPEPPCRAVGLWITSRWIEGQSQMGRSGSDAELGATLLAGG